MNGFSSVSTFRQPNDFVLWFTCVSIINFLSFHQVADTLGKAVESVPQDQLKENHTLADLYNGLLLTEGEIQGVFNRHGLHQIKPEEGDVFDPNVHEALFTHAVEGKKTDTIMTITKIGYKLHERTIRPALVGVYK